MRCGTRKLAMIAPDILDFYGQGKEESRLGVSLGRLELIRTWEILGRTCRRRRAG